MSPPLISKAAARYTGAGGKEHCSLCRHFSPRRGGRCARVLGDISPMGWCKLFSREIRALIADVPFVAGGGGPVPALALDFMTPGTLSPLITFTRASTATYFDSAGVMQTAAVNAPRWDYDPATLALRGLLLEDQRTNGIRNSTMVGAVNGTPGTLPTNWSINPNTTALSVQVVGTGTDSGIPYIDIRVFGTVSTTASYVFALDTPTGIVAANGQVWTFTYYVQLAAGTLNGVTLPQISLREATAAGAFIRDDIVTIAAPTTAALNTQRMTSGAITLTGGGTVGTLQPRFMFNMTGGVAVNMTLRIGAPQLELGDFATSYIPTTSAAVTRSIDSCLIPPASMGWFSGPGGSWFAEFINFDATLPASQRIIGRPSVTGSASPMYVHTTRLLGQFDGVQLVSANTVTVNAITRAATTWAAGRATNCLNGGAVATLGTLATGYGALTASGIYLMSASTSGTNESMSGYLRAVRYWLTVLTDAQLQSMTAP